MRDGQVGLSRAGRPDAKDQLVVEQRLHVPRLPRRTRADGPVALADLERVGLIGLGDMQRRIDQLADVVRRDRLARPENRPQSFEDPPRLLDPIGIAFDPDLAMPGKDLDSDRVANLPEKLVTATEDSELLGVTVQTDCDFRHASPFADPGGGDAPTTRPGPSLETSHADQGGFISYYYGIEIRKNATSS